MASDWCVHACVALLIPVSDLGNSEGEGGEDGTKRGVRACSGHEVENFMWG